MKTTFEFHIDQKVTIWERKSFSIDADTEEEAKTEAMKLYKGDTDLENDTDFYYETLDDTSTDITPDDNGGCSTRELYLHGVRIKSNETI